VRFRIRHLANSAATVRFPEAHLDLVRCGAILHGLRAWPVERDALELIPTLSWHTRVVHVCRRPAGWTVGYNRCHRCRTDSVLATLPVGYRDGFRRALSGRGEVLIFGQRVPVVGTVSMDFIVVDVSALERTPYGLPKVGEEVTLVGSSLDGRERITVEEVAAASGTIPYVVTTQFPAEATRVYAGESLLPALPATSAEREQAALPVVGAAERARPPLRLAALPKRGDAASA